MEGIDVSFPIEENLSSSVGGLQTSVESTGTVQKESRVIRWTRSQQDQRTG